MSIAEFLRRANLAYRLMRYDSSIHPADALAMVVWGPWSAEGWSRGS